MEGEMEYLKFKGWEVLRKINTEEKARNFVWKTKFAGKDFVCPDCQGESFWEYRNEPEIRKCQGCEKHVRLRKGTLFENSKTSILRWVRAIYFVISSKRGMSALELKRLLGMSSYGTVWAMLHKIRRALQSRDDQYKLKDFAEVDGAYFGSSHTGNQRPVLVAVETREWVDKKGKRRERAGFAKIKLGKERHEEVKEFLGQAMEPGSKLKSDASRALIHQQGYEMRYQTTNSTKEGTDSWLPWVHRFISNAKAWVIGTHHGVEAKYLELYLAEFAYRFNRRHDPEGLFHRALRACTLSGPHTYGSLFG